MSNAWTTDEDDVIRDLAGRVNAELIATQLPGRSAGAVRTRASVLGLSLRTPENPQINARKFSDNELIELVRQGLAQTEIAEQLGVSDRTVSKRFERMRLTPAPRPAPNFSQDIPFWLLANTIFDRLKRIKQYCGAGIRCIVDNELVILGATGTCIICRSCQTTPLNSGTPTSVLQSRKPGIINYVNETPINGLEIKPRPGWTIIRSRIEIPVIIDDTPVGLICLSSTEQNAYNEQDAIVLMGFAGRLGELRATTHGGAEGLLRRFKEIVTNHEALDYQINALAVLGYPPEWIANHLRTDVALIRERARINDIGFFTYQAF